MARDVTSFAEARRKCCRRVRGRKMCRVEEKLRGSLGLRNSEGSLLKMRFFAVTCFSLGYIFMKNFSFKYKLKELYIMVSNILTIYEKGIFSLRIISFDISNNIKL